MSGYVGIDTLLYTPLDYVESTGTQWINTGVVPNANVKVELKFALTNGTQGQYAGILGCQNQDNSANGSYVISATSPGNVMSFRAGNSTNISSGITLTANTEYTVVCEFQKFTVNGVEHTGTDTWVNVPVPICLFGRWSNQTQGMLASTLTSARVYYCKIWENDVLIRDYIPALNNNTVCMYDKTKAKYYYPAGGSLVAGTAGEPVYSQVARKIKKAYVGIPTSYTPVEYIESSGTQYIDTGITQNGYHSIIDVSFSNFSNLQIITGTYGPEDNQRYYTRINTNGSLVTQFGGSSGNNLITGPTLSANTRYAINTKLFNGEQSLIVDDTTYGTRTISGQTFPTANIYLFSIWSGGSPAGLASCKMYGTKYYDVSGTLIRDFIPVLDSDNIPCLYDKVEGKFYYNKGTGTYTAGNTTGQPVSIGDKARKIIKGYVGVNGVARLCYYKTYPKYKTYFETSPALDNPSVESTKNYYLVAGGLTSGSPTNVVTAYSKSFVASSATNLYQAVHKQASVKFGDYAIFAGGKTASSGAPRSGQCLAYSDSLTRATLHNLWDTVSDSSSAANEKHFIIGGGTNYYSWQSICRAFDTNFTMSSPSSFSGSRLTCSGARVGNYLVFAGGNQGSINTDFYDNSNVKTTSSNPYNKIAADNLGLSLNDFAVFFGGTTSAENDSYAFSDCKAYDKNKVVYSFNLPKNACGIQGFSTGEYVWIAHSQDSFVYDNNLVLVEHITEATSIYGRTWSRESTLLDNYGLQHKGYATQYNIIEA